MLPIKIFDKLCTDLKQIKQLTKGKNIIYNKTFDNNALCYWLKQVYKMDKTSKNNKKLLDDEDVIKEINKRLSNKSNKVFKMKKRTENNKSIKTIKKSMKNNEFREGDEKYKMFIDIETTGLPLRKGFDNYYHPKEKKYYNNSRIVEIGYLICDSNGKIIKKTEKIIKPVNFTIKNSNFHGITNEKANKEGIPINDALNMLCADLESVDTIITHNSLFDKNILLSECYRNNRKKLIDKINSKQIECTMKLGKSLMNSIKSPSLIELYKYLFNEDIEKKHRALYDAEICKKCYYELKNNNKKSRFYDENNDYLEPSIKEKYGEDYLDNDFDSTGYVYNRGGGCTCPPGFKGLGIRCPTC